MLMHVMEEAEAHLHAEAAPQQGGEQLAAHPSVAQMREEMKARHLPQVWHVAVSK